MTFVYVLIFLMKSTGGEGLAALELKGYSTSEACKTVAEMAKSEQSSKRGNVRKSVFAFGGYRCLA